MPDSPQPAPDAQESNALLRLLRGRIGWTAACAGAIVCGWYVDACRREGAALTDLQPLQPRLRIQAALTLLAFFLSWTFTPLAMRLARRFNVLDIPDPRKVHRHPTPLLGGTAIWAAMLVAFAFSPYLTRQLVAIIIGGTVILFLGVADDAKGLSAKFRLVVQILASCIVISQGVVVTFLPPTVAGRIGETFITVAWIVGIMNALNFLDGMDGLASGLAAISAGAFALIAGNTFQGELSIAATILVGAALGFLIFNFRPARIFLGDAGSTFLGFVLASLAVLGTYQKTDAFIGLSIPILVLGIIIYDFVHITISRIARGVVTNFREWIEYVGKDHLHHRLNHLGLTQVQTVLFIYLLSTFMGLAAFILVAKTAVDKYLVVLMVVIMLAVITVLMELGKQRRAPDSDDARAGDDPPSD